MWRREDDAMWPFSSSIQMRRIESTDAAREHCERPLRERSFTQSQSNGKKTHTGISAETVSRYSYYGSWALNFYLVLCDWRKAWKSTADTKMTRPKVFIYVSHPLISHYLHPGIIFENAPSQIKNRMNLKIPRESRSRLWATNKPKKPLKRSNS